MNNVLKKETAIYGLSMKSKSMVSTVPVTVTSFPLYFPVATTAFSSNSLRKLEAFSS